MENNYGAEHAISSVLETESFLRPLVKKIANMDPGWRLGDIQRWRAPIQNTFKSVSALFITWKSLSSADSALNSAENENFQS